MIASGQVPPVTWHVKPWHFVLCFLVYLFRHRPLFLLNLAACWTDRGFCTGTSEGMLCTGPCWWHYVLGRIKVDRYCPTSARWDPRHVHVGPAWPGVGPTPRRKYVRALILLPQVSKALHSCWSFVFLLLPDTIWKFLLPKSGFEELVHDRMRKKPVPKLARYLNCQKVRQSTEVQRRSWHLEISFLPLM